MFATQAEDLLFGILKLQKAHDRKLWSRSALTQLSKHLREAGLLPSGPRGHYAPHIELTHLVNLLLALAVAEQPAQAPQAVITYATLKTSDHGWINTTLGEFLAYVVGDPEFAALIETVTVCRNFLRATVVLEGTEGPKSLVFTADDCPKDGGLFYVNAVLSGGFLSALANDASDPRLELIPGLPRGGWVGDHKEKIAEYLAGLKAKQEGGHDEETPVQIFVAKQSEEDEPEAKNITYVLKREE